MLAGVLNGCAGLQKRAGAVDANPVAVGLIGFAGGAANEPGDGALAHLKMLGERAEAQRRLRQMAPEILHDLLARLGLARRFAAGADQLENRRENLHDAGREFPIVVLMLAAGNGLHGVQLDCVGENAQAEQRAGIKDVLANVKFDFVVSTGNEMLTLLVSSGDYPEIFLTNFSNNDIVYYGVESQSSPRPVPSTSSTPSSNTRDGESTAPR